MAWAMPALTVNDIGVLDFQLMTGRWDCQDFIGGHGVTYDASMSYSAFSAQKHAFPVFQ